jgi:hypothetical protein
MAEVLWPRYKHDCDECEFVGYVLGYDLYIHYRDYLDEHVGPYSFEVIARYSDDGPDYLCSSGDKDFPVRIYAPDEKNFVIEFNATMKK